MSNDVILTKEEQEIVDRLLGIAAGKDDGNTHVMDTKSAIMRYKEFIEVVKLRHEQLGNIE